MEIKINAVGFSASSQLEDFIQKKISKLDKYHDGIIGSEVTLKLEKDDNLENKVVEVLLNVKGQEVFAKKNAKKFEEAVDDSKASIGENQRERKRVLKRLKARRSEAKG
nr:HPF/RaiA family ribosome-associated protein [Odoribacter splanchnicus]